MKEFLRKLWERWIGMRLALWIDKRHPEYCWANVCVDLGLGWDIRGWRDRAGSIAACQMDCEKNGSCWCGKLMTPEIRAKRDEYWAGRDVGSGG